MPLHEDSRCVIDRLNSICLTSFPVTLLIITIVARTGRAENWLELVPSSSALGDRFGGNVDISSGIAIVSASGDDEFGVDAGAAYLFEVSTGEELFRLTASDAQPGQHFGSSVAISGGVAIVGAKLDGEFGPNVGAVYVFDVSTGSELFKLTPLDPVPQAGFGSSVAIDGHIAIVGAEGWQKNLDSAYLFDVTTGKELFRLLAPDPRPTESQGKLFGFAVGINDATAAVGAQWDNEHGENSGAVYLFNVLTGEVSSKISGSDAEATQFFGSSVGIHGEVVVTGADVANDPSRGVSYAFSTRTGEEIGKWQAPIDDLGNDFGWSVDIDGNMLAFGAPRDNELGNSVGAAYLLDLRDDREFVKILPPELVSIQNFGSSVAIDGGNLVVGTGNGADKSGAYILYFAAIDGDVTRDGVLDVSDIDALSSAVRAGLTDIRFDVNDDGVVSSADYHTLVKDIMNTWMGDANFDGEFNSVDLVLVFQAGEYEDNAPLNSGWATGDWNSDGEFTSSDFVAAFQDGGYERGPQPRANSVPEPDPIALLAIGLMCVANACRKDGRLR